MVHVMFYFAMKVCIKWEYLLDIGKIMRNGGSYSIVTDIMQ